MYEYGGQGGLHWFPHCIILNSCVDAHYVRGFAGRNLFPGGVEELTVPPPNHLRRRPACNRENLVYTPLGGFSRIFLADFRRNIFLNYLCFVSVRSSAESLIANNKSLRILSSQKSTRQFRGERTLFITYIFKDVFFKCKVTTLKSMQNTNISGCVKFKL